MAARLLRHEVLALVTGQWNNILGANVPGARAVVGELTVSHTGTTGILTFDVSIQPTAAPSGTLKLAGNVSLNPGESWSSRVVVKTGQTVHVFAGGTFPVGGAAATVAGEEVDN